MEAEQNVKTKKTFKEIVLIVLRAIAKALKVFWKEIVVFPVYILTHPIGGWQIFKQEKRGKLAAALGIIALYVIMKMLEYKYAGISVNTNNPYKFNSIEILVYGAVPPFLLAVANWTVTTLMDGKGKMKEIIMMACYSYFPIMIVGFFNIILSNLITYDEAQFVLLLQIIGWSLTGFMALTGLLTIHEYGLGKVIWSVILTVVATAVILFLCLLVFNLAQQIYGFFYQIYEEISIRYL